MATSFDDVIDIAMSSVQDYRLDELYLSDADAFEEIVDAFLKRGVPLFYNCKKSLDYDISSRYFMSEFDALEKSILADLFVYSWLEWNVNNITQIENKMTPSDFKHYSEAENLKQKSEYLDKMREKFNQKMTDYGLINLNFDNWANGNFF